MIRLRTATNYDLEVMEGFAKDNIELKSDVEKWKAILSQIEEMKAMRNMPKISLKGVERDINKFDRRGQNT